MAPGRAAKVVGSRVASRAQEARRAPPTAGAANFVVWVPEARLWPAMSVGEALTRAGPLGPS